MTPQLGEFASGTVSVGDQILTVAIADTPELRRQGLMDVAELPAGMDGMLFIYPRPTSASFDMMSTPMPLDIWWFDGDGVLIGGTTMMPCPSEPCLSYGSPDPIRWVLETPQGSYQLPVGATLLTVESD